MVIQMKQKQLSMMGIMRFGIMSTWGIKENQEE